MFIKKLIEKIKYLRFAMKDPVIFGTLVVTVGIFVGMAFAYLLQFFLGRLLSISDYGTFNALLALTNILGVPASVLSTSLIKISSELKAQEMFDKLTHLFWKLFLFTFMFGSVMFLLVVLFRPYLAHYLNIADQSLFIYYGVFLGLSFLGITPLACLQGLLRFKAFAFINVLGGVLRFAIPVGLILLGLSIKGAFIGMTIAGILSFTASTMLLRKNFTEHEQPDLNPYYKKIIAFSLPVLLVNLGMMLLNNMDIILVKRFFAEDLVGYYAGAVTVSKVLLFGTSTVGVVMFPQISEAFTRGLDYSKKLMMFFGIQLVLISGGIFVFAEFPKLITQIMFGPRFYPSVEYIPLFSIFMGLYALINFSILFFLAIGKTKVFLFQIPVVIAQFFLISAFHETLRQVIWVNIGVSATLLVAIFVYFLVTNKSGKNLVSSNSPVGVSDTIFSS